MFPLGKAPVLMFRTDESSVGLNVGLSIEGMSARKPAVIVNPGRAVN